MIRVKKQMALGAVAVMLIACSSSTPSDKELREAVVSENNIAGCENIQVVDVTRVNGIKGDTDKEYTVNYKYRLITKFSALNDLHKKFPEFAKRRAEAGDEALKSGVKNSEKIKAFLEEYDKAHPLDAYPENSEEFVKGKFERKNAEEKFAQELNKDPNKFIWIKVIEKINKDKDQLINDATEIMSKNCQKANRGFILESLFESKEPLKDYTREYDVTRTFIKTDNGWMLRL